MKSVGGLGFLVTSQNGEQTLWATTNIFYCFPFDLFTEQTKSVTKSSTATIAAKSIVEQINRTFSQKIQIIAE